MLLEDVKINPELDFAKLAKAYAAEGFVQIPEFFAPETAAQIDEALRGQLPWRFVYFETGQGVVQLTQAEIQAQGQTGMQQRMQTILQQAQRNIGFCYHSLRLDAGNDSITPPDHPLTTLARYLNSDAFLALGSQIIAETGLTRTDVQASLYRSGNFLTRHIDEGSQNERRAAYTLGFSRNWQTDWGGQLQFINPKTTDVTRAWIPRWNTLSVFNGRMVHAVSPVSAFAGAGRYSVVGWLRND